MRIKRKKTDFQGNYQKCLAAKVAFGMVRGSTEEQVNTLLVQENALRAYAAAKGFELAGIVCDSGTSASRIRFFDRAKAQEILEQMKAQNIFHIFVTKTDRAFRDYEDCAVTCRVLWETFGISVHFTDEGLVSSSEKDKMVLQIRVAVAEEENRRRRDRQVDAFAVMRQQQQRCGHHEPFGWKLDPFRKRQTRRGTKSDFLVPEPSEQQTLSIILDLSGQGSNTVAIARYLNAEGFKPKGKPSHLGPSRGVWYPSTVQSVLEHARHQDGRSCIVDKQNGRLVFTVVNSTQPSAIAA